MVKTVKVRGHWRDLPNGKKVHVKPHVRGKTGGMKSSYRIRCSRCGKMFNAKHTYENNCPKCETEFIRAMSKFGK